MEAITNTILGKRISVLRKLKGISQEDLSKSIGMSRTVVTQIELGNRKLSVIELKSITDTFSISIDKLLSETFSDSILDETPLNLGSKISERIAVPEFKVLKFKNILLYILEKCAGKSNVGETLLYKLLYFSDFNYYELYEEHLSGAEYRKLPFGPVPQKLDALLYIMIKDNMLQRVKTNYHGFSQKRYLPLVKPDLSTFSAREKNVIDNVIDLYSDWSASAISEYSHKDMPWLASEDGEIIDYELAFYREAPFSVRNYD